MSSQSVRRVSECFIRPLAVDTKQPIYFTPFELQFSRLNYGQKGLLFAKPPPDFSITTFLDDLRSSLSATLTHFYPLAARLATRKEENPPSHVMYIDPANSPGVRFIHATVEDVTISDILTSHYVPSVVHSFFDLSDVVNLDGHTQPLLSIQVTELTDGIFIGCSLNHVVGDATSFWHFMAAWSEIFTSKKQNINSISRPPIFNQGSNSIDNLPFIHQDQSIARSEKRQIKERFFHFTAAAVSKLKAKANVECNSQNISSLKAVSALLWRCITRVRHLPNNGEAVCQLSFDNRRMVKPPFSDNYFGSPVDTVKGTATIVDLMAHGLGWAALRIYEAVKNHEDVAVKKWVDSLDRTKLPHIEDYNPNSVVISSSPRFDMYGCEFGLGKAVASRTGLMNKWDGQVVMYPGREGGGSMDVEVCLLPEYMMELEHDEEFISALKSN